MRAATCLMIFVAPLALAACDTGEDAVETEDMPMAERMPDDMPMMQSGEGGQTASAEGTVTAVDAEAGTITIDHGPIATVDWPAMTMAFQADEALRNKVAFGDEVAFDIRMNDEGTRITSITKK